MRFTRYMKSKRPLIIVAFVFVLLTVLTASSATTWVVLAQAPQVKQMHVEVIESYPHDTTAFTQGLLLHEGKLYESTGIRSQSTLRRVHLTSGTVEMRVDLDDQYFAEGLELIGDRLIQITWTKETAFVYNVDTFEQIDQFSYTGQGWGLCDDGELLYMTNSTAIMSVRDPETFQEVGQLNIIKNGEPLNWLNELEYVDGYIYANRWQTDFIYKVDPRSGLVVAEIDASGLLTPAEAQGADVLNGIAYDPSDDTFLITGKYWPKLFRVRFVESPATEK